MDLIYLETRHVSILVHHIHWEVGKFQPVEKDCLGGYIFIKLFELSVTFACYHKLYSYSKSWLNSLPVYHMHLRRLCLHVVQVCGRMYMSISVGNWTYGHAYRNIEVDFLLMDFL